VVSASIPTATTLAPTLHARLIEYFSFRRFPGQLPELDGLRGLAVILVLLRHAVRPFWSEQTPLLDIAGWDFATIMVNGWIGVDLFFVLSGFLITHHILNLRERHAGNWTWKPYLERRAMRIIPAYYAVLFLTAVGAFPYYEVPSELMSLRVLYHMLFLQDYLPANFVVAFWSLGVEEKFYLLAPLLVFARQGATSLRERVGGIVILLFLGIVLRIFTATTNPAVDSYDTFFRAFRSPFHMTMDPILIGVLIAFVYRAREDLPRLTSKSVATIAFWLGGVIVFTLSTTSAMMDTITWWDKTLQPTAIALAFGGMTFGLLFGGGPAALFGSTILFFFARISYSLYLIHLPLIPVSLLLASEILPGANQFLAFFTIFGVLSLACALALHFTIEKPFLLMKDRVY
jgi:peptidoglycan/LPS O-acetylase OafA/YrhL